MDEIYYTHAMWKVKPGNEEQFIEAWKAMGAVFMNLPGIPAGSTQGTLIQSLSHPTLFYSFGPWSSLEDIEAMRADPQARQAIARTRALCEEATPGNYRLVAQQG